MKAFFTFVLLTLAGPVLAQRMASQQATQPPTSPTYAETPSHFQHQADSLLQYLDKSQVPTGILYDRVASMASLDVFGQSYGDADTSGVKPLHAGVLRAARSRLPQPRHGTHPPDTAR